MKSIKSSVFVQIIAWPILFILGNLFMYAHLLLALLPHSKIVKGDEFVVIAEKEVNFITYFNGPYTGGFKNTLPVGTILIAEDTPNRLSLGFGCLLKNKSDFEDLCIQKELLNDYSFTGYSVFIYYREIGKSIQFAQLMGHRKS